MEAVIRATFPNRVRLKKAYEFSAVLASKAIIRGKFLIVSGLTRKNSKHEKEIHFPRLGLVIAKKFAKSSVVRNTLKRVIRESFRIQKHMIPKGDYVVRLYKKLLPQPLRLLKRIIRSEIDAHFKSVILR